MTRPIAFAAVSGSAVFAICALWTVPWHLVYGRFAHPDDLRYVLLDVVHSPIEGALAGLACYAGLALSRAPSVSEAPMVGFGVFAALGVIYRLVTSFPVASFVPYVILVAGGVTLGYFFGRRSRHLPDSLNHPKETP